MPKRKYQTPEIMHDAPLTDNKAADFHFDDFAATFARLIASPNTDTPLAIGINGAWGSGKTSLLLRIKDMLDHPKNMNGTYRFADDDEKFRKCKTVWFDAWKYNDEDELLVALMRVILHAMKQDGFVNRLRTWAEDPKQSSYDIVAMFINAFQVSFGGLGAEFSFQLDPKKHETPSKFEQYTAFFDHFEEAFERLIAIWVHGKGFYTEIVDSEGALVIFIDDLDRCLPSKIVQILETMKLFLDKRGCIFVIGADISIIQRAAVKHYEGAGITGEGAKDYLEKIIQLRFDLPPILEKAMADYLRAQDKTKVDEAMLNRWQALVAAAEVNPRRVKNVINDLNLQWFMAVNSGQAEGVNRDDFICWQALMRAAPRTFVDQIMGTLEDKERRHSFIMDALTWQQGKQEDKELVKGYFSAYEDRDSKRLRGVLKQIFFSSEFTSEALDAMIYMTALPLKVETAIKEDALKAIEPITLVSGEAALDKMVETVLPLRETGAAPIDTNRINIGGCDFMRVPAGKFVMGSKEDNELALDSEKPQYTNDLPYDYWMARFIVTNRQFAEFVNATKYETIAEREGGWLFGRSDFTVGVDWQHPTSPDDSWLDKEDHPVVQVCWDDAVAYCHWFNEKCKSELENLILRLPTEAEWEKAARGAYGNEWPWGNDFSKTKCNTNEGGKDRTTPVGAYSALSGDSPYGCADMVGNVWEWTHSLFQKYPYQSNDGREDEIIHSTRVLRGGSFSDTHRNARCAFRVNYGPSFRNFYLGFRLCVSSLSYT